MVVGDDFSAHILASHVVDPGIPQIANQLIESNSNSRFRRVEIPMEFISQSYSDLFDYYRKLNGSLLIGVFAEDENLGIGAILSSDASALDSFIEYGRTRVSSFGVEAKTNIATQKLIAEVMTDIDEMWNSINNNF